MAKEEREILFKKQSERDGGEVVTMTLFDTDSYFEKNVKPIIVKEPSWYTDESFKEDCKITVSLDKKQTLLIKKVERKPFNFVSDRPQPPIKNLKIVSNVDYDPRLSLSKKYEGLMASIPEIYIDKNLDIKRASTFLNTISNELRFSADLMKIKEVEIVRYFVQVVNGVPYKQPVSLYLEKTKEGYKLGYNPEFLTKAITLDYIKHYAGVPGWEEYGGAFDSFCYMIGHELLHYRFNHQSPQIRKRLESFNRKNFPVDTSNPAFRAIIGKETTYLEELMNNSFLSRILNMPSCDSGIGVFLGQKSGVLFSGYLSVEEAENKGDSVEAIINVVYDDDIKVFRDLDEQHQRKYFIGPFVTFDELFFLMAKLAFSKNFEFEKPPSNPPGGDPPPPGGNPPPPSDDDSGDGEGEGEDTQDSKDKKKGKKGKSKKQDKNDKDDSEKGEEDSEDQKGDGDQTPKYKVGDKVVILSSGAIGVIKGAVDLPDGTQELDVEEA